jgi:hypothetical protein
VGATPQPQFKHNELRQVNVYLTNHVGASCNIFPFGLVNLKNYSCLKIGRDKE